MEQSTFRKGLLILTYFVRIGCFTFGGGWSILAQMEQEFIQKRHWITNEELLELTVVGRSLPGIMITNISILFGYRVAGWFGGLCAVLGIGLPAVVILSLVTLCYDLLKSNLWCWSALQGVNAAVVPIIGSALISLGKDILREKKALCICVFTFVLQTITGWSNLLLVFLGVVVALLWTEVENRDFV